MSEEAPGGGQERRGRMGIPHRDAGRVARSSAGHLYLGEHWIVPCAPSFPHGRSHVHPFLPGHRGPCRGCDGAWVPRFTGLHELAMIATAKLLQIPH